MRNHWASGVTERCASHHGGDHGAQRTDRQRMKPKGSDRLSAEHGRSFQREADREPFLRRWAIRGRKISSKSSRDPYTHGEVGRFY